MLLCEYPLLLVKLKILTLIQIISRQKVILILRRRTLDVCNICVTNLLAQHGIVVLQIITSSEFFLIS